MIEPAGSAETFTAYLRESSDPVVARIENNRILLDPRTVLPNQDTAVIEAIKFAVRRLKQLDQ
jgi:L-seryl-tRNA(Ser) seleniumtransferase